MKEFGDIVRGNTYTIRIRSDKNPGNVRNILQGLKVAVIPPGYWVEEGEDDRPAKICGSKEELEKAIKRLTGPRSDWKYNSELSD